MFDLNFIKHQVHFLFIFHSFPQNLPGEGERARSSPKQFSSLRGSNKKKDIFEWDVWKKMIVNGIFVEKEIWKEREKKESCEPLFNTLFLTLFAHLCQQFSPGIYGIVLSKKKISLWCCDHRLKEKPHTDKTDKQWEREKYKHINTQVSLNKAQVNKGKKVNWVPKRFNMELC